MKANFKTKKKRDDKSSLFKTEILNINYVFNYLPSKISLSLSKSLSIESS